VSVDTRGSSFDTRLAVYTGASFANLVEIAANDDEPSGGGSSCLIFDAVAGVPCFIAVDGYANSEGQIQLNLAGTVPPPIQFNSLKLLGDGTLTMSLAGTPTEIFVLESSTNLLNWETISTNQFSDSESDIALPMHSALPMRFYRTRPLP
jgi:hypothetical protein